MTTTPSAQASSVYLCNGYKPCSNAGMSDFGYGAKNGSMYWRMYSGHNCTNYVAYRMIQAGMSTERPWSGSGMAYNWGHAMKDITDKVPAVGSVAWWDRNTSGAGTSGHVAIVEEIEARLSVTQIPREMTSKANYLVGLGAARLGWAGGRLRFRGVAEAAPGREVALTNLLNIMGKRQGTRSVFSIG